MKSLPTRPASIAHALNALPARARLLGLALCAATAVGLSGCGSTPEKEVGAGMSTEALYADAKDDMDHGNYETAIKKFEKVEGRGAGTTLAQQAELDMAYARWAAKRYAAESRACWRICRSCSPTR